MPTSVPLLRMQNFFQKVFALTAVTATVAISLPPVMVIAEDVIPSFTDISSTSYREAIESLKSKGVIEGYSDFTFRPEAKINRAEFLKIILEARGFTSTDVGNCFPDVGNQWFTPYVCAAKSEGIVSGYPDGTFKPEQLIAFTEAAKILSLAYKQQTQGGSEWYEGYAKALEGSKAIPTSIAALDAQVKRGEMAEMMWRLSENRTDRPSKGYLNVKYPTLTVDTSSDDVQYAKTCDDLQAFMQSNAAGPGMMYYEKSGGGLMERDMAAPAANAPLQTGGGDGSDHSQTTTQVEGVDEGDIVKTDGTNVYILSNQTVRIVKARPGNALQKLSEISFAPDLKRSVSEGTEYYSQSESFSPTDLYVADGKLIVIGSEFRDAHSRVMMIWPPVYGLQRTTVKVYSVSDPAHPQLLRTVAIEGNPVSSRLVGNQLVLVLNAGTRYWDGPVIMERGAKASEVGVPVMSDSAFGSEDRPAVPCSKVAILPRVPSPQYLTVAMLNISTTSEVQSSVVLGNAENIYMSLENLYVAASDYRYHWGVLEDSANTTPRAPSEQTRLYRFSISGGSVTYAAQGAVPGHLLNQFSMDEHGQTFRVATTVSPDWSNSNSRSSNALYTLTRDLDPLGKIEDIAPGESIFAVRFTGNRVYIVTFKQIDPLFVIDTSDARNPKILGKLKIPGYSNYLYPIDANHVLGMGKEVDESIDADKVHSDDAVYYTAIQGIKLAIFDVRDVSNPKELAKVVIGDRGTESEALTNHKALLFEPDRGLLAFPVIETKRPANSDPGADASAIFQGAYVFDVSVSGGFKKLGTITHYPNSDDFLKAGGYWYGGPRDIKRILRLNESLVTVSDSQVRSSLLSTLKEESHIEYPISENIYPPVMY